jgi:hypothetical protein
LPKGIITPSFIEIALAVTKHTLLTDDGRHVIALAHQRWAKKDYFEPIDEGTPHQT